MGKKMLSDHMTIQNKITSFAHRKIRIQLKILDKTKNVFNFKMHIVGSDYAFFEQVCHNFRKYCLKNYFCVKIFRIFI